MYRRTFPFFTYFSLSLFLLFSYAPTAWGAVLITRVQVGTEKNADDDYVEITNTGDVIEASSLIKFALRKTTSSTKGNCTNSSPLIAAGKFPNQSLAKNETLRFSNQKASGITIGNDLTYSSQSAYISKSNTILLCDDQKNLIDKVGYGDASDFEGSQAAPEPSDSQQLIRNKKNDDYQDTDDNFHDFEIFPPIIITPPPVPPTTDPTTPLPTNSDTTVRLNELNPNPDGDEKLGEYIELFNYGSENINLKNWTLRDDSKTGHYTFPNDTFIKPNEFFMLYRSTFIFALNNSNETVSLISPTGILVDTVHYDTSTENVSYNFSPDRWRWSQFTTPGAPNRFNTLPAAKTSIPTEGYVNTPIKFSAKGSDVEGDTLKYVWDFGDGHKSYKAVTTHTYVKTKKYIVTLTIKDSSETTVKSKRITIGKYPKSKVRIVSLTPNPKGSDTDHETIVLKNLSKKTVRLKNWKIATKSTGTKSFVNHTISSPIVLKPQKTVALTNADSRFTLNNGSSQIALRLPDGRTVQTIHYTAPTKTAQDDDRYVRLENRQWAWIPGNVTPKNSTSSTQLASTISTDANVNISASPLKSLNFEPSAPIGSMSQKEKQTAALPIQPLVLGAYAVNQPTPVATPSTPIVPKNNSLLFLFETLNVWLQKFF